MSSTAAPAPGPELEWATTGPDVWRTTDGRYAIVRAVLPEERRHQAMTYTLRKVSPEMARAWPGTLGYFVAERHTLPEAKGAAARDAYRDAHRNEASVAEDFPALALARFWWPISDGTTRGGLVIARDGDQVAARVVGMARHDDPYVAVTYAEIALGTLPPAQAPSALPTGMPGSGKR